MVGLSIEEAGLSDPDHRLSKFGLEHHRQHDGEQAEDLRREEADPSEGVLGVAEHAEQKDQGHQQQGRALDDARAAGASKRSVDRVDADPDDRHLDGDLVPGVAAEGLEKTVQHGRDRIRRGTVTKTCARSILSAVVRPPARLPPATIGACRFQVALPVP